MEEDRDCPTEIRSVQFKETTVQRCHTLDDLKSKFGDIIFVDYEYHSSEEFDDVMLKAKVFHIILAIHHFCVIVLLCIIIINRSSYCTPSYTVLKASTSESVFC